VVFIDRLTALQLLQPRGHDIVRTTGARVSHAYSYGVYAIKDVQFGNHQSRDPVHPCTLTQNNRVEPPASPGPPGSGSVFPSHFTDPFSHLIVQLGGKWTSSDPGGVGLGYTYDRVDTARTVP
jgi:hypothetical protein